MIYIGEENVLSWETFPNVAFSKTYNTDQQVPDSAGTATAFMTGVKSRAGKQNCLFACQIALNICLKFKEKEKKETDL